MAVIWLLGKNREDNTGILSHLAGNYAVRAFSSVNSLLLLSRERQATPPDLLIIADQSVYCDANLQRMINSSLPGLRKLFLIVDTPSQSAITEQNWIYVANYNGDPLTLKRVVASILIKKPDTSIDEMIFFRDIALNLENLSFKSLVSGTIQPLTAKEGKILATLVKNGHRPIQRDELIRHVWGKLKISERALDTHISRLRSKLQDSEVTIRSSYGLGYYLE